jgi:hypothetical protein
VQFPRVPIVFSIAFLSATCLVVHELAHAFAALCCGGGIREFVLFSITPHVSVTGVFTLMQNTWICAAGSAAEILLYVVALLVAPRTRAGDLVIEVTGIFAAIELVGWGISAMTYPNGPHDTDVWKFLSSSGVHPALVPAACIGAAAVFFLAYRSRVPARP